MKKRKDAHIAILTAAAVQITMYDIMQRVCIYSQRHVSVVRVLC